MKITEFTMAQLHRRRVLFTQGGKPRFGYLKSHHECPCCHETYWSVMRGNSGSVFNFPEKDLKLETL